MNNIVTVVLDSPTFGTAPRIYQYNYGQIRRIQGGAFPKAVEVHFSTQEKSGESTTRIGTTADGVTEVPIPDSMIENSDCSDDYIIYAYVYVEDGVSGTTECKIVIPVKARTKPEVPGNPEEPGLFQETIKAVNDAADRAEVAEQKAKSSETEAGKYATSASKSAVAAEKTKEDALKEVGEKKREAIEAIQNQEETSARKIVNHTDNEIQWIQNQTAGSKRELEQTIANAGSSKEELDESIQTAGDTKTALDKSTELAGTAKTELDTSTQKAGEAKTALDGSAKTAGEMQETLSATAKQAGALDTSLGEKIKTGTQLKTDLVASGEKAVQDIQNAGSEQLDKMQAVAEEFTADREQIATNKENIGSLKEDLSYKITKFYASNQGKTHLADSDDGKIQDMMIHGKSNQNQTKGKNLLKYPYIEADKTSLGITFTDNKDGSINVSGTATGTVYYNLYSNRDGKRLTLASGTYKLVTKGRSGCNVTVNNGVNSAKNEGTFTITEGHNEIYCYITIQEGLTVDETIYPMIQLASSIDESYEPYTGGKPSPSPDYPQEIKRVVNPTVKLLGNNILKMMDDEYQIDGLTVTVSNGVVKLKGTSNRYLDIKLKTNSIAFKEGTQIIFSPNNVKSMGESTNCYLDFTNNNTKSFSIANNNTNTPYIIQKSDSEYEFNLFIRYKGGTFDETWKPQVLIGKTITPFKPYTEQTITLPITLNAIPVSSGGNVTIDGQQYIADRVVEKDGVFGIERNIREIHTNTKTMNNSEEYPGWNKVEGISDVVYYNVDPVGTSRVLTFISNFTQSTLCQNNIKPNNIMFLRRDIIGYSQSELIAKAIDVDMYIRLQDAIFEPLPGDIQAKLRTLVTNYPVTNITVGSEELDGYAVFNYPISMANGWNYVKKQLGDTRDYIYDMDAKAQDIDIQSAEAYVNSEYAVALTELEV